jgi:hypothetical protein
MYRAFAFKPENAQKPHPFIPSPKERESHNTHFQCFIKPLSFTSFGGRGLGVWGEAKNVKAKVLNVYASSFW